MSRDTRSLGQNHVLLRAKQVEAAIKKRRIREVSSGKTSTGAAGRRLRDPSQNFISKPDSKRNTASEAMLFVSAYRCRGSREKNRAADRIVRRPFHSAWDLSTLDFVDAPNAIGERVMNSHRQ